MNTMVRLNVRIFCHSLLPGVVSLCRKRQNIVHMGSPFFCSFSQCTLRCTLGWRVCREESRQFSGPTPFNGSCNGFAAPIKWRRGAVQIHFVPLGGRGKRYEGVHIYRSTGRRSMFQISTFCRSTALYIDKNLLKCRTKCHLKMLCRSTALYINHC